jgi:hypothetical protein
VTTPIGQRSTAVREAGHGVMAYVLGRPFTEISVTGTTTAMAAFGTAPPGTGSGPISRPTAGPGT